MTKDNEQPVISGKRRAFVKGAAVSAPVILTLRSGAAFAVASSEVCVPRDNALAGNGAPPVITINSGDDNWVRRPIFCRTLTAVVGGSGEQFTVYNSLGSATSNWAGVANIPGAASPPNLFYGVHSSDDPSGGDPLDGLYILQSGGSSTVGYEASQSTTCYILVHIDQFTDINSDLINLPVGNAAPTNDGLPYVTGSCWGSLQAL
ncbi:MAG: hypothetical protein GQ582_02285 [Methyloprofundus sp.]|nr:hypothetical protein [Methyloprofundus sp.]